MNKKISFNYKSIGNFVRLLTDIMFEKGNERDCSVYHARFDNEPDEIYEKLLEKRFPEGGTLGEEQINQFVEYILNFMQKDKLCKRQYLEYDKCHCSSYVYFKIDETLTPADFGEHAKIVYDICIDYFKDFDTTVLDSEYIKRFICDNFEIKSKNSNLDTLAAGVAADRNYLMREMIMLNRTENI